MALTNPIYKNVRLTLRVRVAFQIHSTGTRLVDRQEFDGFDMQSKSEFNLINKLSIIHPQRRDGCIM